MDHKLGATTLSRDDVELLFLEVAKIVEVLEEYARVKAKSVTPPALTFSIGLSEVLALKPSDTTPTLEQFEKLLVWLTEVKTTAPEVRITLPALATGQLKSDIATWFRVEIHPLVLLSIEYNRALAGGFVLRVGNGIYDFSFRKALLTNSGAMVKVMKRYTEEKITGV